MGSARNAFLIESAEIACHLWKQTLRVWERIKLSCADGAGRGPAQAAGPLPEGPIGHYICAPLTFSAAPTRLRHVSAETFSECGSRLGSRNLVIRARANYRDPNSRMTGRGGWQPRSRYVFAVWGLRVSAEPVRVSARRWVLSSLFVQRTRVKNPAEPRSSSAWFSVCCRENGTLPSPSSLFSGACQSSAESHGTILKKFSAN